MASASEYNLKSAEKHNWSPEDFGLPPNEFGDALTDAVKDFQEEWGLIVDGYCGPNTVRRLDFIKEYTDAPEPVSQSSDFIVVGGKRCPIAWPDVVTFDENPDWALESGYSKRARAGKGAVVHWPVTYEPRQTLRVLNKRGVGTHFEIGPAMEPDGAVTIYQYCDVKHRAYHATTANHFVGIDVSSPVYSKKSVLDKLKKLGHSPRPIITALKINGWKPGPILGYHDNQIKALVALLAALHEHAGVVLEAPAHTGNWRKIVSLKNKDQMVPGVYHHAEVDYPKKKKDGKIRRQGKWDTAGICLFTAVTAAKQLLEGSTEDGTE